MAGWWVVWQVVLVPLLYCQWARQTEPLLKRQTNRSQVKTQHLVSPSQICLKNLVYVQVCLENWVYIYTSMSGKLNTYTFVSLIFVVHAIKCWWKQNIWPLYLINWLFLCPDIKLSSKLKFTKSTKNWCAWIVMKEQYKI